MMCFRWLGFRLEILGGFVVGIAAIFAVLERSNISGSLVGLSISYALQVILKHIAYIANVKILCHIKQKAQFAYMGDVEKWFYINLLKGTATLVISTRGDQKVCGKVLLNRIAFIDCNENS